MDLSRRAQACIVPQPPTSESGSNTSAISTHPWAVVKVSSIFTLSGTAALSTRQARPSPHSLHLDDWNEVYATGNYVYGRNKETHKRERRYTVIARNYDHWNQVIKEKRYAYSRSELHRLQIDIPEPLPKRQTTKSSKTSGQTRNDTFGSMNRMNPTRSSTMLPTSGNTYQKKEGKSSTILSR